MASLGELVARAVLDLGSWSGPLKKAEQEAASFEKSVAKSFSSIGHEVAGALVGITAGVASFEAVMETFKKSLERSAELVELSEATGATVESLDKLSLAAQLAGGDINTLDKANKQLSKTLVEAENPASKMGKAFIALGLNAKELIAMPLEERMGKLAEVFNYMPSGVEKTNLALAMFGKGAEKQLTLMAEWEESMKQAKEQTDTFGVTTAEVGKTAKEAGDNFTLLADGARREMFPAFEAAASLSHDLLGAFRAMSSEGSILAKVLGDALAISLRILGSLLIGLAVPLLATIQMIKEFAEVAAAFAEGGIKAVNAIQPKHIAEENKLMEDMNKALHALWGEQDHAAESTKKHGDSAEELARKQAAAKAALEAATKALNGQNDELKKHADAAEKARVKWELFISGVDDPAIAKSEKELGELDDALKRGLISADLYARAFDKIVEELDKAQAKKAAEDFEKQANALNKLYKEAEAAAAEMEKPIKQAQAMVDKLAAEATAYGYTNAQIEENAILTAKKHAIDTITEEDILSTTLALYDQALVWSKLKESNRLAQEQAVKWDSIFSDINSYGESFFAAMGKGMKGISDWAKQVGADLKNYVLKMLYEMTVKPFIAQVVLGIATSAGASSSALASLTSAFGGAGGGGGGGGGLMNLFGGGGSPFGQGFDLMGGKWGGGNLAYGPGMTDTFLGQTGMTFGNAAAGAGIGAGIGFGASALFGNERNKQNIQIGSTVGGIIGGMTPLGPIGAVIGSAIGAAIGSAIKSGGGAKQAGAFSQFAGFNMYPGETSAANNLAVGNIVGGISKSFDAVLQRLGGKGAAQFGLSYDIDPKGTASSRISAGAMVGGRSVYAVRDRDVAGKTPEEMQAVLGLEAQRALLAALQASETPTLIAKVLDSVSAAGASEDQIQNIITTATAVGDLTTMLDAMTDPVAAINEAMAAADTTQMQSWSEASTALREFADTVPATADGLNALTAASGDYYKQTLQLVSAIISAKQAIVDMFDATRETIATAFLSPEEKLTRERANLASLMTQLESATDPQLITKLTDQINTSMNAIWGMLSPEEQKAQQAAFLTKLDEVQNTATTKLDASLATIQEQVQSDRDFLTGKLNDLVNTITGAGTQFENGANTISATAANGINVDVKITTVPVAVEVNT